MDSKKETVMEEEKETVQDTERERIYQSDLTRKEKWAFEIEKLKAMTFKQKAEYIWEYYKMVFAAIIGACVLVYIGSVMLHSALQKELLSISIVDAAIEGEADGAKLKEDLLGFLGTGDERETVTIDTSISSGDEYVTVMQMSVAMGEGGTDIFICDRDTYKDYEKDEVFKDWKEVLGDDYVQYEPYIENGAINLDMSEKWKSYRLVSYSPAYVGVKYSSEKEEAAKQLIQFFLGE